MGSTTPTRLFKLDIAVVRHTDETFDITKNPLGSIVEGEELLALKSCNYCAVSHVWGKDPPTFSIPGIPWKVPVMGKEKLIFILKTCERRGYEYLWMDILCVNQDNTPENTDKTAEVEKMRRYYKNAHATIVFGSNWKVFASQWTSAEARIKEWNGDRKKAIQADWDGFVDIDAFITDGWFWRVWTLQETVIPATTTPLATVVTDPAPYTSARLLTSDGAPMNFPGLCDLISWTSTALGKLDYTDEPGKYSWIHPGAGIVNDHEMWWMMAVLNHALRVGAAPLHPIQAMLLTRYRNTSKVVDKLKAVYALVDPVWHSQTTDLEALLAELVFKYVEKKEGALLLTMAVNEPKRTTKTWAAAVFSDSQLGSGVPDSGKYPLISAEIKGDTLGLTAAGIGEISVGHRIYGDGSGELRILIRDLSQMQSTYDVSAIVSLINSAVGEEQFKSLDEIESYIGPSISHANSVSSALRTTFSGWHRRIVTNGKKAFLAWLPVCSGRAQYSLLWVSPGINECAVIVEGDVQKGCKKVGIAFVKSTPVGTQTDVKLL